MTFQNLRELYCKYTKSKISYISFATLLILLFHPNFTFIWLCMLWILLVVLKSKKHANDVSVKALIAALVTDFIFSYSFYVCWSPSGKLKKLITIIGLNHNLTVFFITVIFAFISFLALLESFTVIFSIIGSTDYFINNQENLNIAKITIRETLVIFAIALLTITLFSKSSPCYPINDWVDTNIFLTVGKSIIHGKTLYKDIYEQKGPLLFFVFSIPALISETSFVGVYFLEIVTAFFSLLFGYKIVRLFSKSNSIFFMPVYSFIIYGTTSFCHGGSVEELCLPLLTATLYFFLKSILDKTYSFSNSKSILIGVFVGIIFWVKYTMVGMYLGLFVALFIFALKHKKIGGFFKIAAFCLLGFAVVTLPVILYFVINNAVNDLWKVYFYNNLFIYNAESNSDLFITELNGLNIAFNNNMLVFVVIGFGLILVSCKEKKIAFAVASCVLAMMFFIFIRTPQRYYSFILCTFMPLGYACLSNLIFELADNFVNLKQELLKIVTVLSVGVMCVLLFMNSSNRYLIFEKKENIPQYKLAEIINSEEDKSILTAGFLDCGLYTTTGTIPNTKYFCVFNVCTSEMICERERYIEEGVANFIVSFNSEINAENYELVAAENWFFEGENSTLYLYKRK